MSNIKHFKPATNEQKNKIHEYLLTGPDRFWHSVNDSLMLKPSISGYCTTYNCIKQGYPYIQCIQSMLQFCDEVCVVDGGSTDGTWEMLKNWDAASGRVVVKQISRDWDSPKFAVFDGQQKAEARKMCTGDFCWQSDVDEIVHEDDVPKIIEMVRTFPWNIDVISLPVIEYWSGYDKVRADIHPWKWRLSRNKHTITHGIPSMARAVDEQGNVYAKFGDGCDMIDANTFEPLPHGNFYSEEVHRARLAGLSGNSQALQEYEKWFNQVVNILPGVHHYSWFDITRKMRLYRDYWTKHWITLSGKDYIDNAENNMFFDVPWSEVTEDMITVRANELSRTGGHIFHQKWDGKITPWITINRKPPAIMLK